MPMILLGSTGASGFRSGTRSPVNTSSPNGWADSKASDRRPSSPSTTPKRRLPSTLTRAIRTPGTLPSRAARQQPPAGSGRPDHDRVEQFRGGNRDLGHRIVEGGPVAGGRCPHPGHLADVLQRRGLDVVGGDDFLVRRAQGLDAPAHVPPGSSCRQLASPFELASSSAFFRLSEVTSDSARRSPDAWSSPVSSACPISLSPLVSPGSGGLLSSSGSALTGSA